MTSLLNTMLMFSCHIVTPPDAVIILHQGVFYLLYDFIGSNSGGG